MIDTVVLLGWVMAAGVTSWAAPEGSAAEGSAAEGRAAEEGEGPPPQEGEGTPEGSVPAEGTPPEGSIPAEGTPEGSAPAEGTPEGSAPTEGTPAEDMPPEPVEPAPLPPHAPPPPSAAEPRAWGGATHTPLPKPPAPADPSTLASGPWRGRFWLGIGLHASIPVAGRPPARGGVVSAAGEITFGWRLNRFLALHTSISTFAHDAALRTATAVDGSEADEVAFGRITAFDLLTVRAFLPLPGRIQPWAELGAGVGARRGPFDRQLEAAGLVRVGAGVDFWLAPTFTLGVSTAYRTTIIDDSVGHGLRAGLDLGIHW